jgi:hypothetical protein
MVALCQPSSAAIERGFSPLTNSFSDRQRSAREDLVEFTLIMQYNDKQKKFEAKKKMTKLGAKFAGRCE